MKGGAWPLQKYRPYSASKLCFTDGLVVIRPKRENTMALINEHLNCMLADIAPVYIMILGLQLLELLLPTANGTLVPPGATKETGRKLAQAKTNTTFDAKRRHSQNKNVAFRDP